MIKRLLAVPALAVCCAAQEPATRAQQVEQQREETFKKPVPPDTDPVEKAVAWANDHGLLSAFSSGYHGLTPTLGGLIQGSGLSSGLQYMPTGLRGGPFLIRASARLSTSIYQLYDFDAALPRLAHNHAWVDFYARHRNYPNVDYYGPGPNSNRVRADYRLEDTSADVTAGVLPAKWLRLGATAGYLVTNIGPGSRDGYSSADQLYTNRQAPGITRQTNFARGGVLAHVDLRDNPYGPHSGGQYYARYDYYDDRDLHLYSFRRLTAEAQQYVPFFNKKRVIVLRAKSILSYPLYGAVPFWLQPGLGSADDLRGFRPFRYYDNNSLVLNAEYRWEILSGVDGALFMDQGKVFPRPGMLNFTKLQKSYGAGLRFRTSATGAVVMRVDMGVSREGVQFWFVFNDIFAAPRIRTGRELSPPPGRLP